MGVLVGTDGDAALGPLRQTCLVRVGRQAFDDRVGD